MLPCVTTATSWSVSTVEWHHVTIMTTCWKWKRWIFIGRKRRMESFLIKNWKEKYNNHREKGKQETDLKAHLLHTFQWNWLSVDFLRIWENPSKISKKKTEKLFFETCLLHSGCKLFLVCRQFSRILELKHCLSGGPDSVTQSWNKTGSCCWPVDQRRPVNWCCSHCVWHQVCLCHKWKRCR